MMVVVTLILLAISLAIGYWLWNNWDKYFGTENRHRWFAEYFKDNYIYYNMITGPEKVKLFDKLKSLKRRNGKDLKLLEIGVGSGANLKYYPENTKLTAVDPNRFFLPILEKNLEEYPNVELEDYIVCGAENMITIPDKTFDAVVSTITLCSCDNIAKVYREICRVLVPGGSFLYMEHVIDDKPISILKILQRLSGSLGIFPFFFDGCRPDKDLAGYLNKAGFEKVDLKRFRLDLSDGAPVLSVHLVVPHIYGVATAP